MDQTEKQLEDFDKAMEQAWVARDYHRLQELLKVAELVLQGETACNC